MNWYKVTTKDGVALIHAASMMDVASEMQRLCISGKIVKSGPAITVTCGWGPSAHSWVTTKEVAVAVKNCCPDHR